MFESRARITALQLPCAQHVQNFLLGSQHGFRRMCDTFDCSQCSRIIIISHIPFHNVTGHLRHQVGVGIATQELLKQSDRTAKRHLPPLHAGHGKVIECLFLHIVVIRHRGSLIKSHSGGIVVAELLITLADIKIGTLPHSGIIA